MSEQTSSIFAEQTNTQTTSANTSTTGNSANVNIDNTLADLLKDIKNEAGQPKYSNATEALNGLKHAQEFIPQLKSQLSDKDRELENLRNEVLRLKTVEETVARLTERQENPASTNTGVIDEQKIAELISRTLSQNEEASLQKTNLTSVVTTLQQSFGADAEKMFYSKASELGLDAKAINALAAKSPQAVLTLFGIKGTAQPQVKHTAPSGVNTTGFQPQAETFISRNKASTSVGATSQELMQEHHNSRKMVDELHAQGLSVHDLSDPRQYFKFFK
jgi:hypothetical protein